MKQDTPLPHLAKLGLTINTAILPGSLELIPVEWRR